jgi:hypothetical protein
VSDGLDNRVGVENTIQASSGGRLIVGGVAAGDWFAFLERLSGRLSNKAGDTVRLRHEALCRRRLRAGFAGGRFRPSVNETDCIDLVVTEFTQAEVDLGLSPVLH